MLEIDHHSAIRRGLVKTKNSIHGRETKKSLREASYVIINPHGSTRVEGAIPEEALKYLSNDHALVMDHVRSDHDVGITELSDAILTRLPGGVVVNVDYARGLLDANRLETAEAIRGVFHPMPKEVTSLLDNIHHQTLNVIDAVVDSVGPDVPVLNLHSMEPNSVPQPTLTPDTLAEFVGAYDKSLGVEKALPVDLIVGTKGQTPIADLDLITGYHEFLSELGVSVEQNNPFDTDPHYPDWHYMKRRPGLAIDFIKTLLCKGSREERTFNTIHPVVDPVKIDTLADLSVAVLKKRSIDKTKKR